MKKGVVIFGTGKIADVIQFQMREEAGIEVVAFTVDGKYLESSEFNGLPVVPFEEVVGKYPPKDFDMFVALGYHQMNKLRESKCIQAREMGYSLPSFIHPAAGAPKDLKFGENCFIMNHVNVHPRVALGDNVFVWSGAMIGHHSSIGDNCWITSAGNIGGNVSIGKNCFLAMNCTISHSVTVGSEVFLGSNTLITKTIEDKQVVIAENHKPIRLNSEQFLKLSKFSNI